MKEFAEEPVLDELAVEGVSTGFLSTTEVDGGVSDTGVEMPPGSGYCVSFALASMVGAGSDSINSL